MPHRQTVEFLRRRYAVAILRDDADTAGRLRAQLDGIMNHARRPDEARPEAQALAFEPAEQPLGAAGKRPLGAGGLRPRLHLVTPVTGLLERPARRLVIASSRDPG